MKYFNKFSFQTPENVELEFTLAGIGNRAYALVIDYTILALIQMIYFITLIILPELIANILETIISDQEKIELWVFAILGLILFFTYLGYFAVFETLWQGQTPGKRKVNIRVIQDNGKPVRLQQALLRSLLRPIDDFLFIGVFFIIIGKKEKRIGDWVAGTLVIQEDRPLVSATFTLSDEAQPLADQLQLEGDFSQLRPEDFAVIRDYLQRRNEMLLQARHELARELAHQVKDILQLPTIPENTTANLFLEAVYLAYQQINH